VWLPGRIFLHAQSGYLQDLAVPANDLYELDAAVKDEQYCGRLSIHCNQDLGILSVTAHVHALIGFIIKTKGCLLVEFSFKIFMGDPSVANVVLVVEYIRKAGDRSSFGLGIKNQNACSLTIIGFHAMS
jgi:hypothetical protein